MKKRSTTTNKPTSRKNWKRDPDAVRNDILRVASQEIARNGLSGARIDEIAAKTKTSKRMIFYYFTDKAGLYRQVLENAYQHVRDGEKSLDLDHLDPEQALRKLIEFTFDYNHNNPDFIRLVMIENIHHGSYLKQSEIIRNLNKTVIERLQDIYQRGVLEGTFRESISALELHWQISALCFFNISNEATFSLSFGDAIQTTAGQVALRTSIVEMIVRNLLKPELLK